jgi:ArsR family transcriptional regulator
MNVQSEEQEALERTAEISVEEMGAAAEEAAAVLRLMAHPSRLLLLCHLREGPRNVGELMTCTGLAQAYVSQQLARLRTEGLVERTRHGREMRYRLADARVAPVLEALYSAFCADSARA